MDRERLDRGLLAHRRAQEALPESFVATFEHEGGVVRLRLADHGVIGDPLTDASILADGYRYHDILHLAFAASLGWSPVLRQLLGRKRKSQPRIDEEEDGGRARMVEEAICHVIHVRYEDAADDWRSSVSDTAFLHYVRRLAKGFEAGRCSVDAWRRAIIDGLECFTTLRQNGGGVVCGDRRSGTLTYAKAGPHERA